MISLLRGNRNQRGLGLSFRPDCLTHWGEVVSLVPTRELSVLLLGRHLDYLSFVD